VPSGFLRSFRRARVPFGSLALVTRLLMIRRTDNALYAIPGGAQDVGEVRQEFSICFRARPSQANVLSEALFADESAEVVDRHVAERNGRRSDCVARCG
jgi:hypothetical protein